MRHARFLISAFLASSLLGCTVPTPLAGDPPALVGQVEMLPFRQIAATSADVANGATVSLIDPASGNTIATTLSTPTGVFKLTFPPGTLPTGLDTYFLEASKGLGASGASNQPGASVVRLRTLMRMQIDGWVSLTSSGLYVGRSSTALCILSSLKGLNAAQNNALLNTLAIGTASTLDGITSPDTFAGTTAVSTLEYQRVWDLVARSLEQNTDPIASLRLRPTATSSVETYTGDGYGLRDGFAWGPAGLAVADLSPAAAAIGSTVTLYGHGLATGLTVRLNSLSCPVLSTDGTTATFRIPAGATSGNLQVQYGPWINRSLFMTVL